MNPRAALDAALGKEDASAVVLAVDAEGARSDAVRRGAEVVAELNRRFYTDHCGRCVWRPSTFRPDVPPVKVVFFLGRADEDDDVSLNIAFLDAENDLVSTTAVGRWLSASAVCGHLPLALTQTASNERVVLSDVVPGCDGKPWIAGD